MSTPNFSPDRQGRRPNAVVVHTTVGSRESALAWFANPDSGVSCHYLVGLDGQVASLVGEEDTARHAGRVREPTARLVGEDDPNLHTVGIEFEDGGEPETVERPDAQYAAGGRLIAAIASRWGFPVDRDHVIGHREIYSAKTCPGNLDIERLIDEARAPSIACLLPARNAEGDLPGYLETVRPLDARVIALDDGSGDATGEILEQSPEVEMLLTNPRRDGYEGWDDGANRARLLAAAVELHPDWIFFLDVDERLDAEDAAALADFLHGDALPGCAYGLELHRIWGAEQAEATFTWVYRLFAWAPALSLPARRLHFNPVPVEIPRRAWVRTSIRVRHLDSPRRLAERRAKYQEADPERALELRPARLLDRPSPGRLRPWEIRDPATSVLDPVRVGGRLRSEEGESPSPEAKLVCLLPVRNGEEEIPAYLESAACFADAVIALDDGSEDAGAELLEASPLVESVLRNPVRGDYSDWDDAANRARLLDEAARLGADWVFWLDADERIDADDAAALRHFVDTQADPAKAYGLRVFRMIGDESHYDEAGLWAYRLFAVSPGQRLPAERLHFVPVPESIPRSRWRRTTVRIKHLASLTADRRLMRFAKYQQADPEGAYQRDYSHLVKVGSEIKPWRRRPSGLPVLADPLARGGHAELDLEALELEAPILSAVVISRDDEDQIESAVGSVVSQRCSQPFEVIVVVSGSDRTAAIVRERFPEVTLVELEGVALPGRARNAGVAAARGEYVSFPGSHVELAPGSLAARLEAHELGYGMVTGSMLNGTPTLSGWAAYFLDHSGSLPGRPSGELGTAPAHCSYAREFLIEAGGFPEEMRAGEDTVVNRYLFDHGRRAYRAQGVELTHRSRCTNPRRLIRHHFVRGRALGAIALADHSGGPRLLSWPVISFLLLRYIPTRIRRTSRDVRDWGGELRPRYRRALPLVIAGTIAAWVGAWFEVLRPETGKLRILLADQRRALDRGSEDEDGLAVNDPADGAGSEGREGEGGIDGAELLERRT